MRKLFDILHRDRNPYDAVNPAQLPADAKGWGSEDPFLARILGIVRPSTLLEIGTWKGASALFFARKAQELGLDDIEIIAVDPHIGSAGLWTNNKNAMHVNETGSCGTYEVFLGNVKRANLTSLITPFRVTSSIATTVMKGHGITADLVYIDGSHDVIDVRADLAHIAKVMHDDSVVIMDDYDHPRIHGVTEATQEFISLNREFALVAAQVTPRELYTEKIVGDEVGKKAVLLRRGSRFETALQQQQRCG